MGTDVFHSSWPSACHIVGTQTLTLCWPFQLYSGSLHTSKVLPRFGLGEWRGQAWWLEKEQCLLNSAWLYLSKRLRPQGPETSFRRCPWAGRLCRCTSSWCHCGRVTSGLGLAMGPAANLVVSEKWGQKLGTCLEIWSHWVKELWA